MNPRFECNVGARIHVHGIGLHAHDHGTWLVDEDIGIVWVPSSTEILPSTAVAMGDLSWRNPIIPCETISMDHAGPVYRMSWTFHLVRGCFFLTHLVC